jgi:hypothetical protein
MPAAKIIPIESDSHFADYAVQYCELQKPPLADFKPKAGWVDGLLILAAIAVITAVACLNAWQK